ncbi:BgTH12-02774 [Blumeria graminis f. sp. triticale]|uniref:BgTH12-02774 n=1 Tax=Blumeria graminis f. sp. triticale TaxID=1689686 RepID=A0A9W4GGQ3_BLUGR|nr:BgTH12-02774 [Blumeria graminis f. sp. triticale]
MVSFYKQHAPLVYPFQRLLFQSVLCDSSLIPSPSSTWCTFCLALFILSLLVKHEVIQIGCSHKVSCLSRSR